MSRRNKNTNSPKKKLKTQLKAGIRLLFEEHSDESLDHKIISDKLQVNDSHTRKLVLTCLNELKSEGFLNEFSRGKFALNLDNQGLRGEVDAVSRGGAYLVSEGEKNDVYVHASNMNHALHGDTVEFNLIPGKRNKKEGRITKIIERKSNYFVGVLKESKKFAFLITDNIKMNIDLYIPLDKLNGAKDGDKVLGRLTSWPKGVDNPFGEIVERLGRPGENEAEMKGVLIKNDIRIDFPQKVVEAAENVGTELDPEEIKRRRDLRDTLTFTIDPWDAKDFDDALSFKKLENGHFEVGIHIADVGQYVQPGTEMDKEAEKRGNSTYLVDRVIPMLPEQLSNVACSLRPNEDKYTFSAIFELDNNGKIHNEWFGKTVTHSDKRMAYEDAQEIIEGKKDPLQEAVLTLDGIAKILRTKRLNNGALHINSEEVRFKLDEHGAPVEVVKKVAKDANKLIEEFMLLANKRVARYVGKVEGKSTSNTDFVYRVHDKPDPAKIHTFSVFVEKFGYDISFKNMEEVAPKLNKLFDQVKERSEYGLIQTMAIRSMAKAVYDTVNSGHYGLAFDYYTHFTSPIRRYADLMVHRILLDKINGKKANYGNRLKEVCKHISAQERKSIDAERESNKYFQVKFLSDHVGEVFEGTVSGLADFGMFIQLDENYCEGMITLQALPGDHFYFDADRFMIVGRNSGKKYNFGDKVTVQVVGVDSFKRQINFEIHEES